jgi:tetratricopeptide (TPR) repeat protein
MKILRLADPLVLFGIVSLSGLSMAQPPGQSTANVSPAIDKAPIVDIAALLARARDLGTAKDWKALRGVGREIVAADPGNLEGNAWLGLASANGGGTCREAIEPLTKAFNGHATVGGVPKALAKCLGTRPANRVLAGRAWLSAAHDDKDGEESLKAAKFLSGNPKVVTQLFDAYAYADEKGKLPEELLPDYASTAEATKKLAEAKDLYQRALKSSPDNRSLLLALARLDIKLKDGAGAQQIAERLLQTNPDDQDGLIVRADAAAALADPVTEEKVLREALIKQPQNPALKKRLAIALGNQARGRIEAHEPKSARALAEEALKYDAENVPAKEALARVFWGEGNRPKAAQALGKIADSVDADVSGEGIRIAAELAMDAKDLKRAKTLLDRAARQGAEHLPASQARLIYVKGDFGLAEKKIAAYLSLAPDDGEALCLGGDIAFDSGRIKSARDRYERADSAGALPLAGQGRLCEVRVRDNDYESARTACEKALRAGQDEGAVHANLGLALVRLHDKDGARREIEMAMLKGASDKSTLLARGLIAEAESREGDALELYERVLKVEPGNVEANAQSGRVLLKRGKHADAAARLGKAFRANPQDYELAVSLAKAQFGTGALADAQKTIRGIPEGAIDEATRLGLDGQVQHALGNYRRANELFARALLKSPNNAELLALQGENYLNLPHYEKAIQLLEAAQKADPSRLDVSERLARLYAETGNADKAAEQLARIEASERTTAPQPRLTPDSKEIRRVSVSKDFEAVGSVDDPLLAGLGRVLKDAVAADITVSPYVEVIDHTAENQAAVLDARDDMRAKGITGAKLAERYARYALSGSYQLVGDSMQVSCAITDINTRQSYRGSAAGSKNQWSEIEKRAVLEMLTTFVPLSPQERASLERSALKRAQRGNLESVVRMNDAEDAKRRGDYRAALHFLEEAHAADLGNARALAELVKMRRTVTQLNRVAVLQARKFGEVDDDLVLGLRFALASKLASIRGIQVIDTDLVDTAIRAERDYLKENQETIDPKTLPQDAAMQIAANVLLQPSIQGHGEGITVGATLVQVSDGRILFGDQLTGTRATLLDLQNELALSIVRKLYGEPTDEEMAILLKKQTLQQFRDDMEELARHRSEKEAPKSSWASLHWVQGVAPHVPRLDAKNETLSPLTGRRLQIGGLILGGAGAAAFAVALGHYLHARSLSDKVSNQDLYNASDYAAGHTAEDKQWMFYSVGTALLGGGAALFILGNRMARAEGTTVTPYVSTDAAGVSAQGAF